MKRRVIRTSVWATALALGGAAAVVACVPKGQTSGVDASAPPPTEYEDVGAPRTVGEHQGRAALPDAALSAFVVQGPGGLVNESSVEVSLPGGDAETTAVRLETTETSADPWTVQYVAANQTPVMAGETLLASFWIRCTQSKQESGEGLTEFVFELGQEPWSKSVSHPVRAGRQWRQIHVPFQSIGNYQAGEARYIFRLGYEPQTLEIAGLRIHNFGREVAVAELPQTKVSYPGRDADAPWRAEAQERIAEHRQAPLQVTVVDAAGKPASGLPVKLTQTGHDFWFGTAVQTRRVARAAAAPQATIAMEPSFAQPGSAYVELLPQLFNSAVLENGLKWRPLAGDWGADWSVGDAQRAMDWLRAAGMKTRGHVLVWPSWKHLPSELEKLKGEPEKLRAAVREHVRELATAMKGRVDHWDVVNEPYDNHDLMDILGPEEMIEWFKIAHEADPTAKLFLNDYAILSGGPGETGHRAHFEKTARFLIDGGAPIHGLGMQGHFGDALTGPAELLRLLDRYAALGLPIIITEYDITTEDQELAADYTRDFYTAAFSHPAVMGILMWGFWDGAHWKQAAPLYTTDWRLKPSGRAYVDLVGKTFRTAGEAKTDAQGQATVPAFLGNHQVVVPGAQPREIDLGRAGAKLEVKLGG